MGNGLIVGAGPVGLAAALFLARQGHRVRIVEQASARAGESRALAVNPRTLDLLEESGVAAAMLDIGRPIRRLIAGDGQHELAVIPLSELDHRHQFLLALSQAVTERLLEHELASNGVIVEYGVSLADCSQDNDRVTATLERNGAAEQFACTWLLACDGAHSTVRKTLGLDFPGRRMEGLWHLADVHLDGPLDTSAVHIRFEPGEPVIVFIPVVTGEATDSSRAPLWRIFSPGVDPFERSLPGRVEGPPRWKSTFTVAHRVLQSLQHGRICFAGDAAHIHSPVGARGMNLGIEDAWVFAELFRHGELHRYGALRTPVDTRVVRRVERITRAAATTSPIVRGLRRLALPALTGLHGVRAMVLNTVAGLDHPLEPPLPAFSSTREPALNQ